MRKRIIPCLLLKNKGLVKTVKYKNPVYIGDPINSVKIFNEKEVDELVFLDIECSRNGGKPDFQLISQIASECFIPFGYGGGIRSLDDARAMFNLGVEKVIINTMAFDRPRFIEELANEFGSQSIVVSVDVKSTLFRCKFVMTNGATVKTKYSPVEAALLAEKCGAGELLLNSVDRDGTMQGYDKELIKNVSNAVKIPVVACGGAGGIADLGDVFDNTSVSALAAGSMFVFQGKHKAVLISYPNYEEINTIGI